MCALVPQFVLEVKKHTGLLHCVFGECVSGPRCALMLKAGKFTKAFYAVKSIILLYELDLSPLVCDLMLHSVPYL